MTRLALGIVVATGLFFTSTPGLEDGPLFNLLAFPPGMPPHQESGANFVEAPVAAPGEGKNKLTLGAGFGQSLMVSVTLKLEMEGKTRELTISPFFFAPMAPGFLNVKMVFSEPVKES